MIIIFVFILFRNKEVDNLDGDLFFAQKYVEYKNNIGTLYIFYNDLENKINKLKNIINKNLNVIRNSEIIDLIEKIYDVSKGDDIVFNNIEYILGSHLHKDYNTTENRYNEYLGYLNVLYYVYNELEINIIKLKSIIENNKNYKDYSILIKLVENIISYTKKDDILFEDIAQ